MQPCSLGIDLGGTNARAAVVDGSGRIVSMVKRSLEQRTPQHVVETIGLAVAEALGQASGCSIAGCGVGVAGQIRGTTGQVVVAPNLGWREVPFGALLAARLGRAVTVVNDLSAAAWGELRAGAARGATDVFVVFVGSGVGSALICNGQLVLGAGGFAGEFGHIKVAVDGRPCGCGERGCLEAYVGGHNLLAQMREGLADGRSSLLRQLVRDDLSQLGVGVLEQAARRADPLALEIYERASNVLSLAVANQVTVLNPSHLILGGGVLANAPLLRERIAQAVQRYSSRTSREGVHLTQAALGDDSGLIGAALMGVPATAGSAR